MSHGLSPCRSGLAASRLASAGAVTRLPELVTNEPRANGNRTWLNPWLTIQPMISDRGRSRSPDGTRWSW